MRFAATRIHVLLTLNEEINVSDIELATAGEGPDPNTEAFIEVAIVVIMLVAIGIVMTSENNGKIQPGTLVESINETPGGDNGDGSVNNGGEEGGEEGR